MVILALPIASVKQGLWVVKQVVDHCKQAGRQVECSRWHEHRGTSGGCCQVSEGENNLLEAHPAFPISFSIDYLWGASSEGRKL